MKHLLVIFTLLIGLSSCQKNDLKNAFDCNSTTNFVNTKEFTDVLKHFKIKIPTNWNTELYYDEYQSEIYSADTTKQLTETYIIDITWHQGELVLNEEFEKKIALNLEEKEQLKIIKSGLSEFKDLPCYFNLASGKQTGYTYHFLQIFLPYKTDEYYTFTTKIYGNEFVSERICSSLSLLENVKFKK